jgi:probable HAF family extracellular repeat protein
MNGSGTIVGTIHTPAGDLPSRPFLYDSGRFTVLPLMDPTDLGGAAIGVNSRGEVVGYDHTSNNGTTAWLWSNGAYSGLPISGTNVVAFGINSSGTIIGNRTLGFLRRFLTGQLHCTGQRGYVMSRGTTRHLDGFVHAINDLGEAAGGATSGGKAMAAVFKNGVTRVFLNLPSAAVGINSVADVVGFYHPAGCNLRRLFIWSANSGAFDLTPDGYRSAQAAAINDRGHVLGFGEMVGGERPYFLLTPDPNGVLTPKPLMTALPIGAR